MHRLGLGGGLRFYVRETLRDFLTTTLTTKLTSKGRKHVCEFDCFLLEERGTARSGIARSKLCEIVDLESEGLDWNARLFSSLNRWNG